LSDHAHPSFEGATQLWSPDDLLRRFFGPTYREHHAINCLEWGLIAGAMLLTEVGELSKQSQGWDDRLELLKIEIGKWRGSDKVDRRTFPSDQPGGESK
jgi:hypothetical protein